MPMNGNLRQYAVSSYLSGSKLLTRLHLRGRSGARDFSRVVVVSALARKNGITSGARLQWAALRQIGVEAELVDAAPAIRDPFFRARHVAGTTYIFHGDGPQTAALIRAVLPAAANAYRIGYWAWELPDPPQDWAGYERNVAEIWTPSAFSRDSLAQIFRCPIEVVPHRVPTHPARQRIAGQPFTVLTLADSRSSLSRKNPEGALRAFHAAFGTSPDARLILKLGGKPEKWRPLEQSAGDLLRNGNVEVIRDYLDDAALHALFRRADVLLSLHRAEGFGLPMREAMAHGTPVIGTGWSANVEFMSENDGCLVPYKLVPVSDVSAIYTGSTWADPDVATAAAYLRRLAGDAAYYARLALAAHRRASAAPPDFPFTVPHNRVRTFDPVSA